MISQVKRPENAVNGFLCRVKILFSDTEGCVEFIEDIGEHAVTTDPSSACECSMHSYES